MKEGRKANWIGLILRINCLLNHFMEEKKKGAGRRGRRRKQLLIDLKGKRRYWNVDEDEVDLSLCRTRFGRGYELVASLTAR